MKEPAAGANADAGHPIAPSPLPVDLAKVFGGRPVTLHYRNGDLLPILKDCARQAGLALAVTPGVKSKPLTISVTGTTLAEVMKQICNETCEWELQGDLESPLLFVQPRVEKP
jgi:hypothetical protein